MAVLLPLQNDWINFGCVLTYGKQKLYSKLERFGTDKVGYSFAPIIIVWFLFIGVIGIYNFCKYDPGVIKAFNPKYIVDYFSRSKKDAWISLGGIVLCITGTEAMFADLGHFTVQSIQISMCSVVCPSLILAYTGQASYLRKHNEHVEDTFYKSIPRRSQMSQVDHPLFKSQALHIEYFLLLIESADACGATGPLYWTMFVVAVGAAIIASQAMISGTFSIVQQSLAMGCFPRVKVVHTSSKYEGEVFIPEVNYLLMIACVLVTAGFRATEKIGNAYGNISSDEKLTRWMPELSCESRSFRTMVAGKIMCGSTC
ncbi:hypothetical protein AMTR_s00057p00201220 [Amborella trichopoda]|uniref:K+ potassium transporter integral membrane domain-containing protein n=1 Tax=Amborella trichopoda TaxID=13333 RepID=U5D993_AMBTC|nr:hypothetical protein AMTR_s00057p00201220 [Amborella trichopoda]